MAPVRPIHPGDFLKQAMAERGLSTEHLLRAGCDPRWTAAILRRQEELPLRSRALAPTVAALVRVTGIGLETWERVQTAWFVHAKQVCIQRQRRIDAQRRIDRPDASVVRGGAAAISRKGRI